MDPLTYWILGEMSRLRARPKTAELPHQPTDCI